MKNTEKAEPAVDKPIHSIRAANVVSTFKYDYMGKSHQISEENV